MKIGIHGDPAAHSIPGGVGVYVRRLIAELLRLPDEHTLKVILSRHADLPPSWVSAGLIRTSLPFAPSYAAWNFLGMPKIPDELDVVHATGLAIPPVPGAALVATVHDLAVERMPEVVPAIWRQIYLKGLRTAVKRAIVICAVSQATKDELVDAYRVDPERVVVTPEAPNFTPQSQQDPSILQRLDLEGPFILSVGTIEPRKNQIRLVNAFAEAGSELGGYKLVLAGAPGWGQEQVNDLVEKRRLMTRVVLTGKITGPEMVALYSKASVFALPSLYEGFGLPLIEALNFGIPTLSGSSPALKELGGEAALYVDPTDTSAMSAELVKLASDEPLRSRLAADGRSRAAGYTWERTAAATLRAYSQAVGG
ncbi:glycosyltransferase family 1 protein [soil metagenome]